MDQIRLEALYNIDNSGGITPEQQVKTQINVERKADRRAVKRKPVQASVIYLSGLRTGVDDQKITTGTHCVSRKLSAGMGDAIDLKI